MIHTDFITELTREISMRRQVYPGRVHSGKMTQAATDRKIQLMQDVLHIFQFANDHGIPPDEIRLPIASLKDLSAHIKEAESEKTWREIMLQKIQPGTATKATKSAQLATFVQIISILVHIQINSKNTTQIAHQTTLF